MWEEFEDTKRVIRIHKSKKNRQPNGQKKKEKKNDLQNITHKTKDRETRTTLKTRCELRCSGRVGSYCSTSGARRVTIVTNPVISHEWGKNYLCLWEVILSFTNFSNWGDHTPPEHLILIPLVAFVSWISLAWQVTSK